MAKFCFNTSAIGSRSHIYAEIRKKTFQKFK